MCSIQTICSRPRTPSVGLPRFPANAAHAGGNFPQGAAMKLQLKHITRFWGRVNAPNSRGCMNWRTKSNWYGSLRVGKINIGAHRASWIIHRGPIPQGLCVLHKCDNPRCVNPKHLFLGTLGDNNADRERKGRSIYVSGDKHGMRLHPECVPRGERSGSAKLNSKNILYIRKALAGGASGDALAKTFGVVKSCISSIKHKRTWRHI